MKRKETESPSPCLEWQDVIIPSNRRIGRNRGASYQPKVMITRAEVYGDATLDLNHLRYVKEHSIASKYWMQTAKILVPVKI